uniref:Mitochondrial ribosomal protein S21 n=1 Tax=Colobus angolensis palliatus TaxID=336983 RepID=A0A2K5H812_COLAP
MAKYLKVIARTVMAQEGNVESAYRTLNRILTMEGLVEDIRHRRYYEKPCHCMEMARKINFLMRKTQADLWQGC